MISQPELASAAELAGAAVRTGTDDVALTRGGGDGFADSGDGGAVPHPASAATARRRQARTSSSMPSRTRRDRRNAEAHTTAPGPAAQEERRMGGWMR
ncbi:hypothetical protein GCM10023107_90900 [Actinoplanes octamycinicus]|nr:hypothetical protein Aoc01nite_38270 [Actinoplanes octamycinicus]